MPKAFPEEFRRDVVAVARKGEAPITQIAKDFGISQSCLTRWLKLAEIEDGNCCRRESSGRHGCAPSPIRAVRRLGPRGRGATRRRRRGRRHPLRWSSRTACGCSRSSRSRGRPGRAEAALGIVVRVGNSGCRKAGTRSTSRSRDSNFWSRTKCDSPDDVVRAGVLVYGLIRIVSITGGLRWISGSWLRLERRHLSLR
jgi:transposase-like protein